MSKFPLKPTHKPVKAYFEALATFTKHGHTTEGNTRSAFADLLKKCCPTYGWHLVEEYQFKGTNKKPLRADDALIDNLTLVHGLWEAKDADDDLQKEITAKRNKGYPLTNILFQSPGHAVLYQDSRIAFNDAITDPEKVRRSPPSLSEHKQATRSTGKRPSTSSPSGLYTVIERAAESQQGYTESSTFSTPSPKVFQRFDIKQADAHGIVYPAAHNRLHGPLRQRRFPSNARKSGDSEPLTWNENLENVVQ